MRYGACARIGTGIAASHRSRWHDLGYDGLAHDRLVAEDPVGEFEPALQISDRLYPGKVDSNGDDGLGDGGGDARHDDRRAEQPRCVYRLNQVIRDLR